METLETNPQIDPSVDVMGVPKTGFKQRLGQFGRTIKRIDVRSEIVTHPFTAVGICAAAGALVGLVQPSSSGRLSRALFALTGAIGFRLVREAAIARLGNAARDWLQQSKVATNADAYARADQGYR